MKLVKYNNKKSGNHGQVYEYTRSKDTITLTPVGGKAKEFKLSWQRFLRAIKDELYQIWDRLPKNMGTGIYVHQQFSESTLVKGDTFGDADFGDMIWDGRKWIPEEEEISMTLTEIVDTLRVFKLVNTDKDSFLYKDKALDNRFKHESARVGSKFYDGNNGDRWKVLAINKGFKRIIIENLSQGGTTLAYWD